MHTYENNLSEKLQVSPEAISSFSRIFIELSVEVKKSPRGGVPTQSIPRDTKKLWGVILCTFYLPKTK